MYWNLSYKSNPSVLAHTFILLDGEHRESIDDVIGGQRSTQGTAEDILQRPKKRKKATELDTRTAGLILDSILFFIPLKLNKSI